MADHGKLQGWLLPKMMKRAFGWNFAYSAVQTIEHEAGKSCTRPSVMLNLRAALDGTTRPRILEVSRERKPRPTRVQPNQEHASCEVFKSFADVGRSVGIEAISMIRDHLST